MIGEDEIDLSLIQSRKFNINYLIDKINCNHVEWMPVKNKISRN